MRGDQAIGGLAFGRHGAPLRARNALGDIGEFLDRHIGLAAWPEVQRADQRAMDDEIGVAADRRGEMRIAPQVEAEMAVILVGVFGLRLRAQHDFIDQRLGRVALHARSECR